MDRDFYYISRSCDTYYKGKIYIKDCVSNTYDFSENVREELSKEEFVEWSKQHAKIFYGIDDNFFGTVCDVYYKKS